MVHADADDVQKIGYIHIIDAQGRVLKQLKDQPKKVKVDMTGYPSGNYYLQISTGNKMEVHQVVLL